MLKRPFLLEMTLTLLALFLGFKLYNEVMEFEKAPYGRQGVGGEEPVKQAATKGGSATSKKLPELASYEVIAARNLFNNKRKERYEVEKKEVKEKPSKAEPVSPPKKEPEPFFGRPGAKRREVLVLEGVLIFNDYRVALIRNLLKPRDGVKRLKRGDSIGGYTVDSIREDEVVLKDEEGEDKVLALFDNVTPKRRRHIKTNSGSVFRSAPFAPKPPTPKGRPGTLPKKPIGTMERRDER